jgi:small subunit ribosomal protein S13
LREPPAQAAAGLNRKLAQNQTSREEEQERRERKERPVARIAGVDIPREKRLEVSLSYIYGVGGTMARQVCDATGVDRDTRVRDLTDEEVTRLRNYIDGALRVEGDLRREVAQNIKRKMEINCYEGLRHRRGLPVHGQRTHTNARTRKGPKKTVAGKKKVRK